MLVVSLLAAAAATPRILCMGSSFSRSAAVGIRSTGRQLEAAAAIRALEREASGYEIGQVLKRYQAQRAADVDLQVVSAQEDLRTLARGLVEDKEYGRAVDAWRLVEGSDARYSEAMCLFELGDKPKAAEILSELKDHPHALFNLALMEEEDREKRLRMFLDAAKKGSKEALKNAANAYAAGDGCEAGTKSDAKALKIYEISAELGDPDAAFQVGSFYCSGRGLPGPDWDKGFDFHFVAAHAGLPKAQFNLATHYFAGKGVTQDFAKAAEWFEKAAEAGIPQAMLNLANLLDDHRYLGKRRQDSKRAAELREKAASLEEEEDDEDDLVTVRDDNSTTSPRQ